MAESPHELVEGPREGPIEGPKEGSIEAQGEGPRVGSYLLKCSLMSTLLGGETSSSHLPVTI